MSSVYAAQREALIDLSVAYTNARDFTRQVLCTAFGNVALGSVPPPSECAWPPSITQAEADSRLRAVQHFLAQAKAVFKKVLRDIKAARIRLVASGFDVPRSWIIIDLLCSIRGWYLGACGVNEVVESAAAEDSVLETVLNEIAVDLVFLEGEIAKANEGEREPRTKAKRKGKERGRPCDTDPKDDKRIAEAWGTGQYLTFADLGKAKGKSRSEVKRAIDRNRKRKPKGEKRKPK